ncbi:MAG TPA: BamA/TamA family outer membrane protein [Candidatus Aminicenantes bacterium]|nr:BamA/TamA family outer membrane protein [Candidatus Aminicenantes bacterium]HRY65256.1 BamA/TamA family outer membrane protein [Candidatus Aminicenantes bacterium]HRZ72276.1 BamA/TamA family outer membrane protein [Candidatus Aminicenantes bacterium]
MKRTGLLALASFIFGAGLCLPPAAAQDGAASEETSYKAKLVGLPFVYYSPETTLAFGAGGVMTFRVGANKARTRTSSIWAYASYNLEKQFNVLIKPEIYLQGNDFSLSGSLRFERAPQRFYGLGDDTASIDQESFTPRTIAAEIGIKRRLVAGLFAGLRFNFENTTMEKVEAGGLLAPGTIPGSHGGLLAGFGGSLDWDTRDASMFPRRGAYLQFTADVYNAVAGSEFSFNRFNLNLRKYLPLGPDQVLALQAYALTTGGDVPFYKLALVGGDTLLRGYYKGRFRDKSLALVQAEYRALISDRIGVVGFAGAAQVFAGLDHFGSGSVKLSAGTGVRYVISKRDGTTVRLDMAWGDRSFGFYITAQEAF